MRLLGIDEAGRGCVFGPLVVAGYFFEGDQADLAAAGADDSKKISHKKRVAARAALTPLGTGDPRRVSAVQIDGGNLNELEEAVIVQLIDRYRPDRVIMDALGHPATLPALKARLLDQLDGHAPEPIIEPKADANHPVCGAASIFAKTTRDEILETLKETHGDLGSGYPSDPVTQAWLRAHAATRKPWPPFVRTRWSTITDLAQQDLF